MVQDEVGIDFNSFVPQFFLTGFLYCFPFDMVVRIWDSFWLRRFDFLYSVTLGLFKITSGVIQTFDIEMLMNFLRFREGTRKLDFDIEQLIEASISIYEKLKPAQLRAWENTALEEILSKRNLVVGETPSNTLTHSVTSGSLSRSASRVATRRRPMSMTHCNSNPDVVRTPRPEESPLALKASKMRKTRKSATSRAKTSSRNHTPRDSTSAEEDTENASRLRASVAQTG